MELTTAVTVDGKTLATRSPALTVHLTLEGAERGLAEMDEQAADTLRKLILLYGSIMAALVEIPRALCLTLLLSEAVETFAEAACATQPQEPADAGLQNWIAWT